MKRIIAIVGLIFAQAFALSGPAPAEQAAGQPYDIHVILPLTGGGAFLGAGHQDALNILAEVVNKSGGIKGRPLHFVFHDDQTSPQVAVQLATQILAEKPAVVLGSSLVAMCAAIEPLMKDTTVQYCLSPAYHPTAGSYALSASASAIDQTKAATRYYRLKGWTKIASLNNTDATGQQNDKALDLVVGLPENKGVTLVTREHFNPTDISVAAQIERIRGSGAQAIEAGVTGLPAATVFKGMIQAGLDIDVAPTSGNEVISQMEQWKDFLPKGLVMGSALFPEHEGMWKLDPKIEAAQHEMYAALKAHNETADNVVATCWDAGLIVVDALKALGPDATAKQIHDHIANLTNFAGIDGFYNFKENPERGLGSDSAIVVRYDPAKKAFVWLTKPGGDPL
ncbi:MAG TPA: ABC transporter substrate-binding protein [Stellaceae bacterium]|jgi:branched-chain amino acid transport system substrate-binding protein|nr:ABC transporter substrate-binding protein [Stellaceae bacterium]